MPGSTTEKQGSPLEGDIEQSPLIVADGNAAADMPLDLDDEFVNEKMLSRTRGGSHVH